MTKTINWLDIVNEQATLSSQRDFQCWLERQFGRKLRPSENAFATLVEVIEFIRQQISNLHFEKEVQLEELDGRLKNVNPCLNLKGDKGLPLLQAKPKAAGDDAFVLSLADSLLLHFAYFIDQYLSFQGNEVCRCEGLYREPGSQTISPVKNVSLDHERNWRKEIPLLVERGLEESTDLLRCADFYFKFGKARFCSDQCRFRTFQISKQVRDPAYLAEKQKRYRKRKDG